MQRLPSVDSAVMTVAKGRTDSVIADWADVGDGDVFLVQLQHFLTRAVASDFGGRRVDPQIFTGQIKMRAIVEADFEDGRFLVEFDVGWNRCTHGFYTLR